MGDSFAVWTAFVLGTIAAVQPGAFQAFLLHTALSRGTLRTLPLAGAPLLSDLPIALLATTVLSVAPDGVLRAIGAMGAVFTGWLGVRALAEARRSSRRLEADVDEDATLDRKERSARGQLRSDLVRAAIVNFLNPAPWAFWMLVLGPLVATVAVASVPRAVGVIATFYASMMLWTSAIVVGFGALGRLGPRAGVALRWVSGLALTTFAVLLAWRSAFGSAGI